MIKHRLADAVVALIGAKAQQFVRFDGIGAAILQVVGADLVHQTDATAFLAQVQQRATTFVGDGLERGFQLKAAVTAQAEQGIAGQAFGVQAPEDRLAIRHITHRQHHMLLAGRFFKEAVHGKCSPLGGQLR